METQRLKILAHGKVDLGTLSPEFKKAIEMFTSDPRTQLLSDPNTCLLPIDEIQKRLQTPPPSTEEKKRVALAAFVSFETTIGPVVAMEHRPENYPVGSEHAYVSESHAKLEGFTVSNQPESQANFKGFMVTDSNEFGVRMGMIF